MDEIQDGDQYSLPKNFKIRLYSYGHGQKSKPKHIVQALKTQAQEKQVQQSLKKQTTAVLQSNALQSLQNWVQLIRQQSTSTEKNLQLLSTEILKLRSISDDIPVVKQYTKSTQLDVYKAVCVNFDKFYFPDTSVSYKMKQIDPSMFGVNPDNVGQLIQLLKSDKDYYNMFSMAIDTVFIGKHRSSGRFRSIITLGADNITIVIVQYSDEYLNFIPYQKLKQKYDNKPVLQGKDSSIKDYVQDVLLNVINRILFMDVYPRDPTNQNSDIIKNELSEEIINLLNNFVFPYIDHFNAYKNINFYLAAYCKGIQWQGLLNNGDRIEVVVDNDHKLSVRVKKSNLLRQTHQVLLLRHQASEAITKSSSDDRIYAAVRTKTTAEGFQDHYRAHGTDSDYSVYDDFLRYLMSDTPLELSLTVNFVMNSIAYRDLLSLRSTKKYLYDQTAIMGNGTLYGVTWHSDNSQVLNSLKNLTKTEKNHLIDRMNAFSAKFKDTPYNFVFTIAETAMGRITSIQTDIVFDVSGMFSKVNNNLVLSPSGNRNISTSYAIMDYFLNSPIDSIDSDKSDGWDVIPLYTHLNALTQRNSDVFLQLAVTSQLYLDVINRIEMLSKKIGNNDFYTIITHDDETDDENAAVVEICFHVSGGTALLLKSSENSVVQRVVQESVTMDSLKLFSNHLKTKKQKVLVL